MFSGITAALALSAALVATPVRAAEVSEDLAIVFDDAETTCLEKHKISQDDRLGLLRSIDTADRTVKCFLGCFFEEVGMMKGTELNATLFETLLNEEVRTSSPKEEDMAYLRSCVEGVEGDDKCDKAYDYYRCLGHRFGNR